jgi:hypothetical protein
MADAAPPKYFSPIMVSATEPHVPQFQLPSIGMPRVVSFDPEFEDELAPCHNTYTTFDWSGTSAGLTIGKQGACDSLPRESIQSAPEHGEIVVN